VPLRGRHTRWQSYLYSDLSRDHVSWRRRRRLLIFLAVLVNIQANFVILSTSVARAITVPTSKCSGFSPPCNKASTSRGRLVPSFGASRWAVRRATSLPCGSIGLSPRD